MYPPRFLYPGLWMKGPEKGWYLTFDDGPTPDVTEKVLAILATHGIQGSFFVSGQAFRQHPHLILAIQKAGHTLGFHGHEHLDGFWKSQAWLNRNFTPPSGMEKVCFFRAPYGRLWPWQYEHLKSKGQWVHWSFMAGDFYPKGHPATFVENYQRRLAKAGPCEIFVFHDSEKAQSNVLWMLEETIQFGLKNGHVFNSFGGSQGR
jgi:peptidoglycan/xylan/chitin deacetylase (PgdA/CDA1 family)